jgi:Domain of unknown function (DUF4037)
MANFIPGLSLSEQFYHEAVRPILDVEFPGLAHSAALIGSGSEVLGFDTEMSTDHDWGPRVLLFLSEEAHARDPTAIQAALRRQLPARFRGYRTDFAVPEPPANEAEGVRHTVPTLTLRGFFLDHLRFDIGREIEPADWLTFPEQELLAATAGAVFHDDLGLQAIRDRLAYYPHDVWLYLLAAAWTRIAQEEHLMGRAGLVGDEIGSAIIGARLVRDLMRLCFLMEKRYAPYPKWFGTAFARLACGKTLGPILRRSLLAETWAEREKHLCEAYESVAAMHNELGITKPLPAKVDHFFSRPFRVIHLGGGFAGEIRNQIADPEVKRIAGQRLIGSIDQWSDSTDLLADASWRPILRGLYARDATS